MKNLILSLTLISFTVVSASAEKITWNKIAEETQKNNPSVISAKMKLENAEYAYNNAVGGYLPTVTLNGSASQGTNGGNFSKNYSYGLNASLSLFSGFETYNTVKQMSAQVKIAELEYKRAVSDAAYEAAYEYLNLMWAYETVNLLKQIKERRIENKDMIKLKYDSGNVDIGSLKRVEADVETASYDLRKAERYIETASAALLKTLGRNDTDTVLETDDRLTIETSKPEKPNFNELITKIPEFLSAQYAVESNKAQAARSKSSLWPSLSLSGSLSRHGNHWAPDTNSSNIALSLSYPLFSGTKRYFDIKTATVGLQIAEENFKNTANRLKYEAVAKYNTLTDNLENIKVKELYFEAAKLQAEISQSKYINGLTDYQNWYSIENDYISSQRTLLDAKKAAIAEKALWYNFTGEGFIEPGK